MAALAILVLDADSRAGIACIQSLGRLGHAVHLAVRRRNSPAEHSRYCAAVHPQPPAQPLPPAVAWLRYLHERHDFALVIPTTEAACRWLLAIPEDDPLRQRAVLPSDEALHIALDPLAIFALARESGLPVPPVGAPAAPPPGRCIGVQALCDRGRLAWHFVDERLHEWPLAGGDGTLRRAASAESELVEMSRRLLERLRWHGAATVDWRRDASGRLSLEALRPVVSTSLPLAVAAGVDLPGGLLSLVRGRVLPAGPPWRVGHRARHVSGDVRWSIDHRRAGRNDAPSPAEPSAQAAPGWLRGVFGDESWDGWSLRDSAVARSELRALAGGYLRDLVKRFARGGALARARRRHAAIAQALARGKPPSSVIFLCLGNLCRSPFAAAVATPRLHGVTVSSAGFLRHDGRASPARFVETARSFGVDLSAAHARRVSAAQIAGAQLIVCMDLDNLSRLAAEFPDALERTTLLGLFDPDVPPEVRDPYTMPESETRAELERMLAAVDALARAFEASRRRGAA
jgi:protein-tyrosine phosphatase